MAQFIIDRSDLDFLLFEKFKVQTLSETKKFSDFNQKVIEMVVTEARNLAIKEILPTSPIGDKVGCRFENGEVILPEEFHHVWKLLRAGEWFVPTANEEWGGQGMPKSVALAARDYINGANIALFMIAGLSHGAGCVIEQFGTREQKNLYLKKIYSGEWATAMHITESESGSDLTRISTTAEPRPDGKYSLCGSKIFITGGHHTLTKNIIHLVLARIKGAPEGSQGLSLFLVPGFHVDEKGRCGEKNDIICTGIEEKMGLHASPTCSMSLGSRYECLGTLLGEKNKGLYAMFSMMNDARLLVGSQGHASASSSFLLALNYAKTRVQGSIPGIKSTHREDNQIRIIDHPDVRRMLLTMKAYTEGMRSILFYIAFCQDQKQVTNNESQKETFQNLIDFLIPIGKGYVTDRAVKVCDMAIQVFGDYGYTNEYPVEQILRDVRITTIYEGTNGIQAIDLFNRKLTMKKGRLFKTLITEIEKTLSEAKNLESLKPLAAKFEKMVSRFEKVVKLMSRTPEHSSDILKARSLSGPFLHITGDIILAWMLLWRAHVAQKQLDKATPKKRKAFYQGQMESARFFIENIGPITMGRMDSIMDSGDSVLRISTDAFGGR